MNNEPVTYLKKDESTALYYECDKEYGFPVYTHPVKELTDEEIEEFAYAFELWQLHNPDKGLEGIMAFARAILRKAQENG